MSGKSYEKLDATEKLRLLLMVCGIPATIPPSLAGQTARGKGKGNKWENGPQALTEIRNALVHSDPEKRQKTFGAIADDVLALGLQYLELIILNMIDYRGDYHNRLAKRAAEVMKTVPWP